MPLYDYKCPSCGHVLTDVLGPFKQTTVLLCSNHAESVVMQRVICAPTFHVHGFAAKNLYAGGQKKEVKTKDKNVRVTVESH